MSVCLSGCAKIRPTEVVIMMRLDKGNTAGDSDEGWKIVMVMCDAEGGGVDGDSDVKVMAKMVVIVEAMLVNEGDEGGDDS